MKLKELLRGLTVLSATADMELEIAGVSYDSRSTREGELFVAVTGYAVDGHRFIPAAREKGAAAVLCEKIPEGEVPYVQVADTRQGLAVLGLNWFGRPAEQMTMVAVTGTNGKTTTTYLLKSVLERCLGAKVGLIGTNQNMIAQEVLPTERTTPESFELQGLFRRMADAGCTHVVMEVSSHALAEERVHGVHFKLGIFTNLTQDHLDFHGTMENYCDAKALLFRCCDVGVINADDPWTERLLREATCKRVFFAEKAAADLRAEDIELAADHVAYGAVSAEGRVPVRVPIPGGFTVYNTLGVLAAAHALGVAYADAAAVLREVHGVKGRVEVVPTPGKDYTILIDYAHSPDGLENVLRSARGFAKGRVVAVFGCGGDRDATKRPKMGRIAAELADFVIVTSDNPRTEEPMAIIRDILPGLEGSDTPHAVVENRVEAIHYAMDHAEKDDIIVLCGKGHETYQEINHVKHHLDEREVVAAHLQA
ncbi:MAG: UDP-N-acetylmuramoyl-L-alanyl-D-glutamate--2,6-diaminopimelate ligase [Oscillospiraceae bacterium]